MVLVKMKETAEAYLGEKVFFNFIFCGMFLLWLANKSPGHPCRDHSACMYAFSA
jgi:hypothetical protein